ncbi:MAG: efflux RND transporter periplasmic adaptor subunit [Gammaproteobacteria bacterium]|nr:efflux RND transporter periplasmic adaptor subunit [Gammaproteobacteria bacterium]
MIRDTSGQDSVLTPKPARRRGLAIGAALVLATGLAWSWQHWTDSERAYPLARLRLGEVRLGEFVRDAAVQGKIVAAHAPTLYAPTTGVLSLEVQAGDRVAQGQVLARIASPELANEYERARSSLSSLETERDRTRIAARQSRFESRRAIDIARVTLTAAERDQRRTDDPKLRPAFSTLEVEAVNDALDKARIELSNAEKQAVLLADNLVFEEQTKTHQVEGQRLVVANLQRQIEALELRSPVDGMVGTLNTLQKAVVAQNAPVLSVVDLSAYAAELEVPESYADDLVLGMDTELSLNGKTYSGRLSAVSPEVQNNLVLCRVQFTEGSPEGLRQNQRLSARILLDARKNVLSLPRGPFLEDGGGRIAYVVSQGIAEKRAIKTGASSVSAVEILEGLKPGERVVLSATSEFKDAQRVLLTE